jgi:nitrogen fixation protein FixH
MTIFRRDKPRELTGRKVLLYLVVSFGIVFAVNGYMVKAAISTFGGVETQSSYKAGQQFENEVAIAERQAA